ncbi:MAG: TatD DNase family protein [Porticoccaceae bacterium]
MTMPKQPLPALIDAHVHTDDDRLEHIIDEVLTAARTANVVAQIVPSISARLWPRVKSLCGTHDDLFACYGLHPCFQDEHTVQHLDELATWIGREKPVALGECGLDYFMDNADKPFQQQLFAAQLALAREFNLPIVIHARSAVDDVIEMIKSAGHYKGMIHSFNGSSQQATRLIDLGYKLSFGGAVTYDRATKLREMVASLPLDAIVLETDAPDQTDSTHAGQLNQPAYLSDVWKSISTLRGEDANSIAKATTNNAIELFSLPKRLLAKKKLPD